MKINVGKFGHKTLLQYGKWINSIFVFSKIITFLAVLVTVRKTQKFQETTSCEISLISQEGEKEQKHMITAGKLRSPKVYWRHALGEYLYSCSAVTFLQRKSHRNQWEQYFI